MFTGYRALAQVFTFQSCLPISSLDPSDISRIGNITHLNNYLSFDFTDETICRDDSECNGGTCETATATRGAYCVCMAGYTGDNCNESKSLK